jgi:DNA polymerase-4
VKIKYSDFTQATRSRTGALPFSSGQDVLDAASELLKTVYPFKRSVRLLGVTLSSLTGAHDDDNSQEQPELDFSM